jgi:hypothetical protein
VREPRRQRWQRPASAAHQAKAALQAPQARAAILAAPRGGLARRKVMLEAVPLALFHSITNPEEATPAEAT